MGMTEKTIGRRGIIFRGRTTAEAMVQCLLREGKAKRLVVGREINPFKRMPEKEVVPSYLALCRGKETGNEPKYRIKPGRAITFDKFWGKAVAEGKVSGEISHKTYGWSTVEIMIVNQETETGVFGLFAPRAVGRAEKDLARQFHLPRAVDTIFLNIPFSVKTRDGRFEFDLASIVSAFPEIRGMSTTDPVELAIQYIKLGIDHLINKPVLAKNDIANWSVRLGLPHGIDRRSIQRRGSTLSLTMRGSREEGSSRRKTEGIIVDNRNKRFSLLLSSNDRFPVWRTKDIRMILRISRQIERAYRPWLTEGE